MPEGEGADRLLALMNKSQQILHDHPVNKARRAHGKTEATSAWFWGQGTRPAVPTLKERFGLEGSVISAVDLVNGVGRLAGLEVITVPGATGFLDTDYAAKGRYGLKSLEHKDFLLLHIEAPDEAGHMGRADLKKEAIERIDEAILGPMLEGLTKMGEFRLLLQPDHATPSQLKTHSSEPVPFAIISNRSFASGGGGKSRRYTEADAKAADNVLTDGYRLIDTLFGSGGLIEAN
jgi:2,3-bisphosphoglycerate-independent phosphoglycerate mutase